MLIGNIFHLLIVCFISGERDDLSMAQILPFGAGTVSLAPQYHDTNQDFASLTEKLVIGK